MPRRRCPRGTITYTIKPGDTLYKIALEYNTTPLILITLNPYVNPYYLRIGETICVPEPPIQCPNGTIHTVNQRDTLLTIAVAYNVSYNALKEANPNVDIENLEVGQRICIPPYEPSKPCPNRTYIIKKNETLSSIAEKFVVSATDILILNPEMAPGEFVEGRLICLPEEVPV
ncbi:LysM peptidoglycan-binding domain-containing protein [Clostridiisalibacter paucivorans]|uniref:LysM peptidoglycan-binding domain-containing protein n=1 Tax=Clostridiisalibacter paucivorans TaxID=408753 RepID=UPI000556659A|nr:LysM domain-containing protein [Clostridiisalibacter paucivorans]